MTDSRVLACTVEYAGRQQLPDGRLFGLKLESLDTVGDTQGGVRDGNRQENSCKLKWLGPLETDESIGR